MIKERIIPYWDALADPELYSGKTRPEGSLLIVSQPLFSARSLTIMCMWTRFAAPPGPRCAAMKTAVLMLLGCFLIAAPIPATPQAGKAIAADCVPDEPEGRLAQGTSTGINTGGYRGLAVDDSEVTDEWQSVLFGTSWYAPVVIVGPVGSREADPAIARITKVTDAGFSMRVAEWSERGETAEDRHHVAERISFLVGSAQWHQALRGEEWAFGTFTLSGTKDWTEVRLPSHEGSLTRVFLTPQTANDADPFTVRMRGLTDRQFEAAIFEDEGHNDGHCEETIGYLAIFGENEGDWIEQDGVPSPYQTSSVEMNQKHRDVASALMRTDPPVLMGPGPADAHERLEV